MPFSAHLFGVRVCVCVYILECSPDCLLCSDNIKIDSYEPIIRSNRLMFTLALYEY